MWMVLYRAAIQLRQLLEQYLALKYFLFLVKKRSDGSLWSTSPRNEPNKESKCWWASSRNDVFEQNRSTAFLLWDFSGIYKLIFRLYAVYFYNYKL